LKYQLFLDETGDHGLSHIDGNFPLFLLCGCLIREDKLSEIESAIKEFKLKYFGTIDAILHSREIRRHEGSFQILFDLDLKGRFYEDWNKIVSASDFTIIGAGIDKVKHTKRYGNAAINPYALSLSFIMERLILCLNKIDKEAIVNIKVEKRGKKEDQLLLAHYNSILDQGTYYISKHQLQKAIKGFKFHSKRDNIIGLQLSDLCAYPLARHLLSPKVPYIPFDVIKGKIYCDKIGRFTGYGLKLFP
jgi:hypothetical protein